ncbi:MAG TPA: Stk1 family PASTA domain-containing Ser/Thr kinase [Actinotalea sp.]|nr:Stk1 family PASTA domain-containing Ser/Thr kinase [Actinotalea sp.]
MNDVPRILGGRYEVGELIGRGGMAEVHIGHDTRLGRTVAIKILRSDLARDPSFQARFRREAQAAASLNHPAVVAVYDTGEDVTTEQGGALAHVPFIVMEYVEGHTVRDILRDGAAVPIEEAVEITAGVLSALEYSHHAGIVHRDIKPANVMLTPTGAVKVMDFGIARAMADAAGTMTQTQAVIGTAQYLSPEQARGEQVDSRSDLYSTGCLLFELLTGRPPFIGDSPVAVAYQHAREEAQPPSTFAADVPETLDRITMKALAKARESRYSSAAEFRSDLEAVVRGGAVSAPPLGAVAALAAAGAVSGDPTTAATQVIGAQPPAVSPWGPVGAPAGTPEDETEEPRSRRGLMWALIGVALAAIVGIVLILQLGNATGEPEVTTVEVPGVVGLSEAEARSQIEALDLEFVPIQEASLDVPEGTVIRTDPEEGTLVEPGDEVEVFVSSGADAVPVPDLSNLTESQARGALEALGFTDIQLGTSEDSPTVEKDRVTRTEPVAGTSVDPAEPITIFLSTGQVQVPDFVGTATTGDAAKQALIDLGLVPVVQEEESDAAPGVVIRQDRGPGPVPQRSVVTITVAIARPVEMVTVPDVAGQTIGQASAALGAVGLNAVSQDEQSDTVQAGRVIRTDPAAGSQTTAGGTVTVYVSSGPAPASP